MRKNRFQNKVATSSATQPVAALISTLLWFSEGIHNYDLLWGWIICGLTTYVWVETNNANALIRIRSRMTSSIYLLLMGAAFGLHRFQESSLVVCLTLSSYYLLFKSYQQINAVVPIFHAYLCLSIGSVFFPQLLYFVPFYLWYTIVYLRSLTWRTFWAAVIGLAVPYWFLAGYFFYLNGFDKFTDHFLKLTLFQPISINNYLHFDFLQVSMVVIVALFTIIAALHCIRTSFNDKIRTRMLLYLILTQEFLIALFLGFQPIHFDVLLGLLIMNSAPILAHYFALTSSRFSNSLFILFLVALAALTCLTLWMQWSIF
ncbi:MAG: hypothetical protein LUC45_06250 [Paraprevotella sp.]|nr:hypothetical protein [Paraprevotella sp.]